MASPAAALCKACGRRFGFPVDFCVFCGVAQAQLARATPTAAAPTASAKPPGAQPEQPAVAAKVARQDAAVHPEKVAVEGASVRAGTTSGANAFRSGPESGEAARDPGGFTTGPDITETKQTIVTKPKGGSLGAALSIVGVLAVIGVAGVLRRSAPSLPAVPPKTTIHLAAHGRSELLSFTQGERIAWSYPPCAAPALPACVELIAAGQERFTLGGSQDISSDRVTGHYAFHRDMPGRLRSGADEGMDVEVSLTPK